MHNNQDKRENKPYTLGDGHKKQVKNLPGDFNKYVGQELHGIVDTGTQRKCIPEAIFHWNMQKRNALSMVAVSVQIDGHS